MERKSDEIQFVICVNNAGYQASLDMRKVYQVVADPIALSRHFVRVVDESGEEYLYPADFFVPIDVPHAAQAAFVRAS